MKLINLYEYVKKKSGGNNFHQMSEVNKIKHLVDYISDVIEYFELQLDKKEDKVEKTAKKKPKKPCK